MRELSFKRGSCPILRHNGEMRSRSTPLFALAGLLAVSALVWFSLAGRAGPSEPDLGPPVRVELRGPDGGQGSAANPPVTEGQGRKEPFKGRGGQSVATTNPAPDREPGTSSAQGTTPGTTTAQRTAPGSTRAPSEGRGSSSPGARTVPQYGPAQAGDDDSSDDSDDADDRGRGPGEEDGDLGDAPDGDRDDDG